MRTAHTYIYEMNNFLKAKYGHRCKPTSKLNCIKIK